MSYRVNVTAEVRNSVLERDKKTCKECGGKGEVVAILPSYYIRAAFHENNPPILKLDDMECVCMNCLHNRRQVIGSRIAHIRTAILPNGEVVEFR